MSKFDVFSTKFAQDIYLQKYSMNGQEKWADTAKRVVDNVCGQLLDSETQEILIKLISERKFIPGGRYLYSAGRPFHQVNNCFLFRAEDSREGWADLMQKITSSLMSGGGVGVDYSALREAGASIKKTGGFSTGPLSLIKMVNEAGRHVMQGGQRRSALWSGLNWSHKDIFDYMTSKDYSDKLKKLKEEDFTFELPMELTNISVIYDTEFFVAMEDKKHELHKHAKSVWEQNCRQAFSTAEPGMSMNFLKDNESLRNACVTGDTEILTKSGYTRIDSKLDEETEIWNGFEWSKVTPKVTGENQQILNIKFSDGRELKCTPYHKFHLAKGYSGESEIVEAQSLRLKDKLIKHELPIINSGVECNLDEIYTQGFYSADGVKNKNLIWLYEPKFELESSLCVTQLGKEYVNQIGVRRKGFKATFDLKEKEYVPFEVNLKSKLAWMAGLFDGDGCELKEGGLQLTSVDFSFLKDLQTLISTCGVNSKVVKGNEEGYKDMPDQKGGTNSYFCKESKRICIPSVGVQKLKELGMSCKRLNFDKSPNRDASRFVQVIGIEELGVEDFVYCFNEPKKHLGLFNGVLTGQCTEVTSEDDSDKCNLGTLWMNRFDNKEDFGEAVKYATQFLLCGGIYSDVPNEKIREVGDKNNRIGLGLGGMHEWLMTRGYDYNVNPELHKWLNIYEQESNSAAYIGAKDLGVAIPKGIRSVAPTGTIGILAETTTGIEPLFCKAYKRRYLKDEIWVHQYVVDGSVKRLMEQGVEIEKIQDAYDLSFKQRVKFQADVQNYVDMAISSTCNLPQWGSEENNEESLKKNSKMLLKYAKRLRGFTCYPDGSRGGQPLTRVELDEALGKEGQVFEEHEDDCVSGVCGV
jgi:ribonucleotide reductase alpha subunit